MSQTNLLKTLGDNEDAGNLRKFLGGEDLQNAITEADASELLDWLDENPAIVAAKGKRGKGKYTELDRRNSIDRAQAIQRREAQNIGFPPTGTIDWTRRNAAVVSLRVFLETYFPSVFTLEWSDDHLRLIDKLERAIVKGELSALAMARGSGKALALDTPLPTPSGWTTMGEVKIGDQVFDENGLPTNVVFATEVQHNRECFVVEFSDGEKIVADADHQWTVRSNDWKKNNGFRTVTTKWMHSKGVKRPPRTLKDGSCSHENRFKIPVTEPLVCPEQNLEIDPYLFGYWLGDGSSGCANITCSDEDFSHLQAEADRCEEVLQFNGRRDGALCATYSMTTGHRYSVDYASRLTQAAALADDTGQSKYTSEEFGVKLYHVYHRRCEKGISDIVYGNRKASMFCRLKRLGVVDNKHVPDIYKRASYSQRLAIVQGVMDSDGSVDKLGRCEITLKSRQLLDDVIELLVSLGIKVGKVSEKFVECNGRMCGPYHRISFTSRSDVPVFKMPRKRKALHAPKKYSVSKSKSIVSITPAASVPVRCIQVDSPSRLYLAGKKMTPTHNTAITQRAGLWAILAGHRKYVAIIAATETSAQRLLKSLKSSILHNDKLKKDFRPELHCLISLGGKSALTGGQHVDGELTGIEWNVGHVNFGNIDFKGRLGFKQTMNDYGYEPDCSNAVLCAMGITGNIRGEQVTTIEGEIRRPDIVLIDDPQTKSPLKLDTPVLTTKGWKTIEAVSVGDKVFGGDGNPCNVIGKSPVYRESDCYEIEFDDGYKIVADAEHKWVTQTQKQRTNQRRRKGGLQKNGPQYVRKSLESVVTTREIFDTVDVFENKGKKRRSNHSIDTSTIEGSDRRRFIRSVKQVDSVPVQCIETDSPDHTFLVGRNLIRTHNSASSKNQVQKRHETLMGDVLGMAGPGKSIAGLCAMTVIYANDLADRLLDPEQSPEWQGERCKMVYKWPENMSLWDEYQTTYEEELRAEKGHEESSQFIRDNFDAMHEGAHVGWEARFDKRKELSALHHAYNLRIRDAGAFAAEYQNEPLEGFEDTPFDLNADEVARRVMFDHKRNDLPDDVETITCAIDVQKRLLYYMVCGWTPSSRCFIMDYGCYPDQKRMYFAKREAPVSMQSAAQTDELDDALRMGLDELTDKLMQTEYGEQGLMIDKAVIDARWGDSTEIIRRFCRESPYRARLHPSMGVYIGANSRKWQKLRLGKRDRKGVHCKLQPPTKGMRGRPELLIDTNFWKNFAASRLSIGPTSNRAIVLFDAKPAAHRMISEHFCSEWPKKVTGKTGEVVTEWDQPKGVDNDWWDCLVYNCALASVSGVKTHDPTKKKRTQKHTKNSPPKPAGDQGSSEETARQRMERKRKRK